MIHVDMNHIATYSTILFTGIIITYLHQDHRKKEKGKREKGEGGIKEEHKNVDEMVTRYFASIIPCFVHSYLISRFNKATSIFVLRCREYAAVLRGVLSIKIDF